MTALHSGSSSGDPVIAPVRGGAAAAVSLLAVAMSVSTAASTLLHWVNGFFSVASLDAALTVYLVGASALFTIALVFLYAAVTRRWSRLAIFVALSTLLALSCAAPLLAPANVSAVLVRLLSISLSTLAILHLWAIATDMPSPHTGAGRLAVVAAAAAAGALVGLSVNHWLGDLGSPQLLSAIAGAMTLAALGLVWAAHVVNRAGEGHGHAVAPPGGDNGLQLVVRDGYLRLVAGWTAAVGAASVLVDQLTSISGVASSTLPSEKSTVGNGPSLTPRVGIYVLVVLVQLLLASQIVRRAGMTTALLAWPLVTIVCHGLAFVLPSESLLDGITWPIAAAGAVELVGSQALFLVVARNAMYDGRVAIHLIARPLGSVIGLALWSGLRLVADGLMPLRAATVGALILAMVLALLLGRRFEQGTRGATVSR